MTPFIYLFYTIITVTILYGFKWSNYYQTLSFELIVFLSFFAILNLFLHLIYRNSRINKKENFKT